MMIQPTVSNQPGTLLSIITPVYNGEKYIEKCIQAVLNQQCDRVEHLIVDGGSTDRTIEIVKHYAEQYPHIRWISEKDRGQSDAMNKGIALANSEIITFLNVDDFYEPNVLNRILEIFQTLPNPSFIAGNCKVWNDDGKVTGINKPKKLGFKDLLMGFHVNPFPMNPSAYFYHRALHDQAGLYDVDDHYTMDLDFIIRAVRVAHTQYFDEDWGNYQMLQGTKTMSDTARNTDRDRVEEVLKKYRKSILGLEKIAVELVFHIYKIRRAIKWFLIRRRDQLKLATTSLLSS